MRQRRNRIRGIDDLHAVAIISMAWTKGKMLNDPRVVSAIEVGYIDSNSKKADIIAAVKLLK